jgi:hypothetical protein
MPGGDRRAAVAMFAAHRLNFNAARAIVVHWLPHTAGVRDGSRERQSHGGQSAHEGENEQQSGGQAMHGGFVAGKLVV